MLEQFVYIAILWLKCCHCTRSVRNVYEVTSTMMRFCVLLSVLEIVHVQLKLVKATLLPTVAQVSLELSVCLSVYVSTYMVFTYLYKSRHVQVFGRMLVLFGVIAPIPIIQNNRVIAMLFFCWSSIEIFR